MPLFPTIFAPSSKPLVKDLGEAGNAAARQLADKNYVVLSGFTEYLAGSVSQMAYQQHIREFCPKDPTVTRFATLQTTERWLSGGRGMFILAKDFGNDGLRAVGYGWTGVKQSPHVPGAETTFAIRISEEGLGQKLAAPFSRLIIAGSAKLYGAKHIWLETWQGNGAAIHAYQQIGFEIVTQKPDQRPTVSGGTEADTRVYMSLPDVLSP